MSHNYSPQVMKRFLNPKHLGRITKPDAIGEAGNMKCGDVMKLYLSIDKKEKKIRNIKFETLGCVAAIASTDAICELAKGKTIKQAKKIGRKDIVEELKGLPAIKVHCSVLGEQALKNAIKKYEKDIR